MKKFFALALSLVMVLSLAACGAKEEPAPEKEEASKAEQEAEAPEEGFYIGFSNCYIGNTWRTQFVEEIEARFKKYVDEGVLRDYVITNANNDLTEQNNQVLSMVNMGVDAIIIDPMSATGMADSIATAQEAGIIVIIAGQDCAYEGTIAITQDWAASLEVMAEWLFHKMEGEGDIVYLTGLPGVPSSDECDVIAHKLIDEKYPGINLLGEAPGEWTHATAQQAMATFLNTYGADGIDGVLTQDCQTEGILQAYANAGVTPTVPVVGDTTKQFYTVWANEYPDMESAASPHATAPGALGVDIAVGMLQGKTISEDALQPSALDPNMKCVIKYDPPYFVMSQDDIDNMTDFVDWFEENYPLATIYSREEILEIAKDIPDGYIPGMSDADMAALVSWAFGE